MQRSVVRTLQLLAIILSALCVLAWGGHAVTTKPLNDNFANAQLISGNAGVAHGTNIGATKEAGEPNHAGNPGGMSVWFRWVAPNSGVAEFDTGNSLAQLDTLGSNFDTTMGVYPGSQVNALTLVGSNNDVSPTDKSSQVKFAAVGGTTYYIAVDGFQDPQTGNVASGTIALSWTLPPPNDAFAHAQNLPGTAGSVKGTTLGATAKQIHYDYFNGVWYRFRAPATGYVTFTPSNGFSASVLAGTSMDTLTGVSPITVPGLTDSSQTYALRSGAVVYVNVASQYGGYNDFTLAYKFVADTIAPTVTIRHPLANSFISSLRQINGAVADNPRGSGVHEVDVYLRRHLDGKYWDGGHSYYDGYGRLVRLGNWVATPIALKAALSTTDNNWRILDANAYSTNYGLPNGLNLLDGTYTIQAVAYDNLNNRGTSVISVTADQTPPTGSFTMPANKATVANLDVISGRAMDKGSGVSRVDLQIQRRSDKKYWTGTTWSAVSTVLETTFSGGIWTRNAGNPIGAQLLDRDYNLLAIIYDRAQNVTRLQNLVTVRKAAVVAANEASATRLSTATASVADNSVQLKFLSALDPESASDPAHYRVTVNGRVVGVDSAGYSATSHSVTLSLGESLRVGDAVTINLDGVVDTTGATVAQRVTLRAQ